MASLKNQTKSPKKRSKKPKESGTDSSKSVTKIKKIDQMKTYKIEEIKDRFIGKKGSLQRENYENELRLDLLGDAIRQTRIKRNLTQEQLGKLVGVQKAQICKLENNFKDARINTIIKVFDALHTKILFNVKNI